MSRLVDTHEYQQGANFERCMATWIGTHGYAVSRVRYGGMVAPTLTVWSREVILPDLQFMHPNGSGWLECKRKKTCGLFEARGILTTGIDTRHWQQYRDVERATGFPVYIAFGHSDQDEVRVAQVSDSGSFTGPGRGSGMRYWPWHELRRVASFSEVMACAAHLPQGMGTPLFGPANLQLALDIEAAS